MSSFFEYVKNEEIFYNHTKVSGHRSDWQVTDQSCRIQLLSLIHHAITDITLVIYDHRDALNVNF